MVFEGVIVDATAAGEHHRACSGYVFELIFNIIAVDLVITCYNINVYMYIYTCIYIYIYIPGTQMTIHDLYFCLLAARFLAEHLQIFRFSLGFGFEVLFRENQRTKWWRKSSKPWS